MSGILGMMAALFSDTLVELGSNANVEDTDTPTSTVAFGINPDGTVQFTGDTTPADFDWATPKWATVGNPYHVRCNVTGVAPTGGDATATWHALSTGRSWTWAQSGTGSTNATATLLISKDGGSTTIDTVVYTITAAVPP